MTAPYATAEDLVEDQLRAAHLRIRLADPGCAPGTATELQLVEDRIDAKRRAANGDEDTSIASWLRDRVGLTATEERVLWLLIACELSATCRVAIRGRATEPAAEPTLDAIRTIVYGTRPSRTAWEELSADGPLRRLRLIERADSERPDASPARHQLRCHPRIIALVLGSQRIDDELAHVARIPSVPGPDQLALADGVDDRLDAALAQPIAPVLITTGMRGAGRASALTAAARRVGRAVLEIDAAGLDPALEITRRQLAGLARECILLARTPLIRNLDALAADRLAAVDRDLVKLVGGPVLATASRPMTLRWSRTTITVQLEAIAESKRIDVWSAALPEAPREALEAFAARFPIAPGCIRAAVDAARGAVGSRGLSSAAIADGVRAVVDDRLGGLATRVTVTQSWDDLVLPEDQVTPIVELLARVRHRRRVLEDWGFAAKLGRGLGVSALFSGPPGTGKTMVAGLLARDLGLDLYQVDLARITSKWIGETEKNLAAIFDAAEAGHAVLLFDEADSLFGKRTQVASSNDRYANLEVNFLLQRMESFAGICVLTTNHDSSIDEAFRRRLSLHVRFAVPEEAERERLWRAMIPGQADLAAGIDFSTLARRFDMSGGYIRNAVLRAAYLAAEEGHAIDTRHLAHAAHLEYEGLGKIAPRA